MKLLAAFGPVGILAAGVATTIAAVPKLEGDAGMLVGFVGLGVSVIAAAIPLTVKITRLEAALRSEDRDFRRVIFGGENEVGIVQQMSDHHTTLYGTKDVPEDGMVSRVRDAQKGLVDMQLVLNEQERRMGALESPRARGDQSG